MNGYRKLNWPEFSDQLIIKIFSDKQLAFFSENANITSCKKFEKDKSVIYTLSICAKDIKAGNIKLEWITNEF